MHGFSTILRASVAEYLVRLPRLLAWLGLPIALYAVAYAVVGDLLEGRTALQTLGGFVCIGLHGLFIFCTLNLLDDVPPLVGIRPLELLVYMVTTVLVYAVGFVGLLLLVVPGVLFLSSAIIYPLLILREQLGPIEAIRRSFMLTRPFLAGIAPYLVALWGLAIGARELLEAWAGDDDTRKLVATALFQFSYSVGVLVLAPLLRGLYVAATCGAVPLPVRWSRRSSTAETSTT
jgi:hypothetical protein